MNNIYVYIYIYIYIYIYTYNRISSATGLEREPSSLTS